MHWGESRPPWSTDPQQAITPERLPGPDGAPHLARSGRELAPHDRDVRFEDPAIAIRILDDHHEPDGPLVHRRQQFLLHPTRTQLALPIKQVPFVLVMLNLVRAEQDEVGGTATLGVEHELHRWTPRGMRLRRNDCHKLELAGIPQRWRR